MKRGVKTFICVLGGMALAFGARAISGNPTTVNHGEALPPSVGASKAADTANPYDAIVERNVFDLKDPPPPEAPKATNEPPPNVRLTGIMSVFGHKQALFMVQKTGQPGKAAEPEVSYILSEGQRQDGLEVMEIDSAKKKVKIKNDGIVSTITFEVAKGGGPGGGRRDMTPGQPHMGKAGFTPMPERTLRTSQSPQYSPTRPGGGTGYGNAGYGNAGFNAGGVSAAGYNQNQRQASGPTAEEQTAVFLAQQQEHAADIAAGKYPPTPPIPGITAPPTPEPAQQPTAPPTGNPNSSLPPFLRPQVSGSFPRP